MEPRLGIIACVLCGFFPAASLHASPALATQPSLTFFSTVSEEPFARLEAESIGPRYTRHGPFRVPAPGLEVDTPALTLHDQPCTAEDWARLLRDLEAWRRLPGAGQFLLTLPDGRVLAFLRPPRIEQAALSGLVRPLAAASDSADARAPLLLRVAHDGDTRLRIDLRTRVTRHATPDLGETPSASSSDAPLAPSSPDTPAPAPDTPPAAESESAPLSSTQPSTP